MSRKCTLVVLLAALLCSGGCHHAPSSENGAEERVVIDMMGRRLRVPVHIHRVFGMSPMGTILFTRWIHRCWQVGITSPTPEKKLCYWSHIAIYRCWEAGSERTIPATWRRSCRRTLTC